MRLVWARAPDVKSSVIAQLSSCEDALLRQERRDGVEPALVVRGFQVLCCGDALDSVAKLVEVVDATPDQSAVHRKDVRLPVRVEGWLANLLHELRKAFHASDIVDPAHHTSGRHLSLRTGDRERTLPLDHTCYCGG